MSDKELLELSAKAYGIEVDYRHGSDAFYYDDDESGRERWCPLDDDGQAFRLMVKLALSVNTSVIFDVLEGCEVHSDFIDKSFCTIYSDNGESTSSFVRREIVRAAAEIGKLS